MAYVNNGTERSLRVSVYKKVGGNYVQGYPKTYDGQQSWGNPGYPTLTDTEARQLSDAEFSARLLAFKTYVEGIEAGADFNTDIVGDGAIRSNTGVCLPTTTTTQPDVFSFSVKYSTYPIGACTGVSDTAYSNKQFPGVGDFLYQDSSLSVPWTKGAAILMVNPNLYGTKTVLIAVVTTGSYGQGEIIDTANGYDCNTTPTTTTTTTVVGTTYYKMIKCDGSTCYMPKEVKDNYEAVHGSISTGSKFYGAIFGDSNYLYLYTGQTVVLATPPSCYITGITATTDSCP